MPLNQRLTRQECSVITNHPSLRVVFNRLGTLKYVSDSVSCGITAITGSKQQKKAVLRNQLRRRLYAVFREYPKNKDIKGMIYVSKHVYTMTFDELKTNLYDLLAKATKNS